MEVEEKTRRDWGWYAIFLLLVIGSSVAIYLLTGQEALGAAGRFIWNSLVMGASWLIRAAGGLLRMLVQGVGWRRVSRLFSVFTGVGLGYAASVVVSDRTVGMARGWRGKLRAAIRIAREKWQGLPLIAKLLLVVGVIASQIYLNFFLVVFPVAFLVPVMRKIWVGVADMVFGNWYRKNLSKTHRAAVSALGRLPPLRQINGGLRLMRLRYLYAWRLWRHDPRYRDPDGSKRRVSLFEPIRLWWRGELDGYVGRPLLSGKRPAALRSAASPETVRQTVNLHPDGTGLNAG